MTAGNTKAMTWRTMQQADLAAVSAIAEEVHPDYPESPEVFAERLHLFASGCRVAVDESQIVRGYAITHPALLGQPPSLDCLLHRLPAQADCLYLHDIALTAATRHSGLGAALVDLIRQHAKDAGFAYAALVAVNNSTAYWQRRGFSDYAQADEAARMALANKIASYDAGARYLVMKID